MRLYFFLQFGIIRLFDQNRQNQEGMADMNDPVRLKDYQLQGIYRISLQEKKFYIFCIIYFFKEACDKTKIIFRLVNSKKPVYIRFRLILLCMIRM